MNFLFAQSANQDVNTFAAFLPIILIGIVFYVLILRPQSKQRKDHENIIENLKKGDNIITRGGLYGKIVNFQGKNNNKVVIDVGSGLKLNIMRSHISGLDLKEK